MKLEQRQWREMARRRVNTEGSRRQTDGGLEMVVVPRKADAQQRDALVLENRNKGRKSGPKDRIFRKDDHEKRERGK